MNEIIVDMMHLVSSSVEEMLENIDSSTVKDSLILNILGSSLSLLLKQILCVLHFTT